MDFGGLLQNIVMSLMGQQNLGGYSNYVPPASIQRPLPYHMPGDPKASEQAYAQYEGPSGGLAAPAPLLDPINIVSALLGMGVQPYLPGPGVGGSGGTIDPNLLTTLQNVTTTLQNVGNVR